MDEYRDSGKPARADRWRAQAAMTLAAWLIAFLIVMLLSTVLRDQLASLPLPLRALVLSGVLVVLMVNLIMPLISTALARALPPPPARRRAQKSTRTDQPASRLSSPNSGNQSASAAQLVADQ